MESSIRHRWAFLVGVNNYRESSRFGRLNHCVNDVLTLERLLKKVGFGVACLHDQLEPDCPRFPDTADTIKAELRKLRDKISPDDLLLVYLACHGTRSLSADDAQPYLILRNTRPTLPQTALAVADLKAEMQALSAERQILLLDACHMGLGKGDRADSTAAAQQFVHNVHELATGFALLTPSTAVQTTKESDQLQHGVFSRFVLDGLGGKAMESTTDEQKRFVTVNSLGKHVSNEMVKWSYQEGYEQLPQGYSEGGLGDFIVVDYRLQPLPSPFWRETASAAGETGASRSSAEAKEPSAGSDRKAKENCTENRISASSLPLGKQLKLDDLKRQVEKNRERIASINKKIEAGVDFEEEGKLEARKNGIFEKIDKLNGEIKRLELNYD
jgi:hypothetical protein